MHLFTAHKTFYYHQYNPFISILTIANIPFIVGYSERFGDITIIKWTYKKAIKFLFCKSSIWNHIYTCTCVNISKFQIFVYFFIVLNSSILSIKLRVEPIGTTWGVHWYQVQEQQHLKIVLQMVRYPSDYCNVWGGKLILRI